MLYFSDTFHLLLAIFALALAGVLQFREFRPDLLSGLVCGLLFFVGLPLLQVLVTGDIPVSDLPLEPITRGRDGELMLLFACFGVGGIVLTSTVRRKRRSPSSATNAPDEYAQFRIIVTLYFAFTLLFFALSGKWRGGHWYSSGGDALASNPAIVLIANFANVFRVVLPFIAAYQRRRKLISVKSFLVIVAFYVSCELVLVNNRIGVLFAAIAVFYAFPRKRLQLATLGLVSLPMVAFLNHAYPIARGMLWTNGASLSSAADAISTAVETRRDFSGNTNSPTEIASSLFESSNLNVVKYVFDTFEQDDFRAGETVFLKSLLFPVPKSIWPGKPDGFGGQVGREISGLEHLTLNCTSVGEFYGNFGLFSILIFPWTFAAIAFAIRRVFSSDLQRHCLFMCGFASVRFEFSFVVISIFCLLIVSLAASFYLNTAGGHVGIKAFRRAHRFRATQVPE
ncbi:hypothetical protein [Rhodopirellula sp. SWK7]|uniref:hypothetical protein n=1 Tax=Rhodopirellula sp. SWK7 TaxID=595460 RepID=UPI0002BD3D9A|nr:hypothetical protein [Rhodopirellula sp. SWK7]EMI45469.1 membrane protein [Rhodopirellula sp. SWK7]